METVYIVVIDTQLGLLREFSRIRHVFHPLAERFRVLLMPHTRLLCARYFLD
jgi:hypothetical protein